MLLYFEYIKINYHILFQQNAKTKDSGGSNSDDSEDSVWMKRRRRRIKKLKIKKRKRKSSYNEDKPYECSECSFCTKYKHNLDFHVKTVHKKIKPFACSDCDFNASTKGNLNQHINSVHVKQKVSCNLVLTLFYSNEVFFYLCIIETLKINSISNYKYN